MSPYAISGNSFAACEELGSVSSYISEKMVVCPKPRRLGLPRATTISESSPMPIIWQPSGFDSKAGSDPSSDIILMMKGGGCESDQSSIHPFFSGSPPSRAPNPLIQDFRFASTRPILTRSDVLLPSPTSSSSTPGKSICGRSTFSDGPSVRIEGFDCLDRDRRKFGIPTLA
ncbi:hypothetical protein M569_16630 [Genlisea aurea]|uniref:Uncharacterized protein n=1 Tax=Genlisea aurea TaxID=192259 RepID=S8C151_9LAMI|nr:hypothetical protein M569_16630 [Genlisea aurea]